MPKAKNTGIDYEKLIHKIYTELEPNADVRFNDKILGRSGIERQIDVSIRTKIAGHDILIIIQAKDHSTPIDIKVLGEFVFVVNDIGASKGILICSSGFSRSLIKAAKEYKIDLFTAHDASNIRWQTVIKLPVIRETYACKVEFRWAMKFTSIIPGYKSNLPKSFFDSIWFFEFNTIDGNKISMQNAFLMNWDNDPIYREPGRHKMILFDTAFFKHEAADFEITNAYIDYTLQRKYHFKFVSPDEYRGIREFETGEFRASHININAQKISKDFGDWEFTEDISKIAAKALHYKLEMLDLGIVKINRFRQIKNKS